MTFPSEQQPLAPTIIIARSPQVSGIKIALSIFAILVALFLGLLVLIVIGIETGPVALMLGLITATLPVPLYIILVLWIDRYEAEPLWMLATTTSSSAKASSGKPSAPSARISTSLPRNKRKSIPWSAQP